MSLWRLSISAAVQALFIQGGIQMIVSEVVVAILLAVQFNSHSGEAISPPIGVAVIVFICLFVAGFGWSWGPLGWLVPNEIQPLETRSAGQVSPALCMHSMACSSEQAVTASQIAELAAVARTQQ